MEIRPFRDEDVAAVVALLREARPVNLTTVESFRHWGGSLPERARLDRWVAEDVAGVSGYGSGFLHLHGDRGDVGGVHVTVRGGARRAGIGDALYVRAREHLRRAGARRLTAVAVDDDGYGFLEHRGFAHSRTERYSRLDVTSADLSGVPELRRRAAEDGFDVVPFTACRPEDVHTVDAEASADVPDDTPMTNIPFDEWRRRHWDYPRLSKEGSFVVVHGGRPVTIAMLLVDRDGNRAGNDITGTLRAFRGRGLARLAKLHQIEWLVANGYGSVVTSNDTTNAPMLAVNTRLGYVPFAEERTYVRELEAA